MASKPRHNESCKECKTRVEELLSVIFGEVKQGYGLNISSRLEGFKDTPYYDCLSEIFELLQKYRGHTSFIHRKRLPNVDFFVPFPGFVFEYDESQHFTKPREISLCHYPGHIKMRFDKERWLCFCRELHKKDNSPLYRDEQRAWYDTLRDFAPYILGLKPTVRVFARDLVWCSLQISSKEDIQTFSEIIGGKYG